MAGAAAYLVEGGHGLDHFLGEGLPDAGGSNQHGWLDGLDGLQQGLQFFMLMSERLLEVLQRLFSRLNKQTLHNTSPTCQETKRRAKSCCNS